MCKLSSSQKLLRRQAVKGTLLLLLAVAPVGCRNAAYSDLYVESMASEIRQLEDQLYDYDNEYHILEQELASVKAENEKLRLAPGSQPPQRGFGQLPTPTSNAQSAPNGSGTPQFSPRDNGDQAIPEPVPSMPLINPAETSPAKQAESILEAPDASGDKRQLEDPSPVVPKDPKAPPDDALEIPNIYPGTPITITPGAPSPPAMPVLKNFSSNDPQSDSQVAANSQVVASSKTRSVPANSLELNLSRIEVPNQLTSNRDDRAQLKFAAEKPSDMRIVELAFHPSLSRAANFDDQSDDDGLYLVLQPKNVEGQMVPTFGTLEIAVHDPAKLDKDGPNDTSRIGRWNYSANEVKSKFQPIGSSQGIHLTLPWNGPDPEADRVLVFVRYTLPDGRQVPNEKTIFVSGKGNMKTVWVPRSDSSAVVPASGEQSVKNVSNVVPTQVGHRDPAPVPK
jgi:hypothetical protein